MYQVNQMPKSSFKAVKKKSFKGETIEQKLRRITNNKEPITDGGSQPIYSERKDGVLPEYNIRTDRMEAALDAMDYIQRSNIAKREQGIKDRQAVKEGFKDHADKTAQQTATAEGGKAA